jgi:hypothetical protein
LFVIVVFALIAAHGCSSCDRPKTAKPPQAPEAGAAKAAPEVTVQEAEAPPPAPPLDAAQQAFVDAFIAANNSHDSEKLIELLAPAVRDCVTDDTRAFFEKDIARGTSVDIPEQHTARFEELQPGEIKARRGLSFPLPPTHVLVLTFVSGDDEVELNRQAAFADGRWYLVTTCPGDEYLERIKQRTARKKEDEETAQHLFSQLDGSTRLHLRTLLEQGKLSEAYMDLRSREPMKPQVARRVLRLLEAEPPGVASSSEDDAVAPTESPQ